MYISKIHLTRVRSFPDATIDLLNPSGDNRWLLLVGDNGSGKSTVLSSIAMGLCDVTAASGLLTDTAGDWIRWGEDDAIIVIELVHENQKFEIKTIITRSDSSEEQLEQITDPKDNFPWHNVFACAYGANRSIEGEGSHRRYNTADSLYTLFNYDYKLHDPELMLRRYAKSAEEESEICLWLDKVLMLPEGSTSLDDSGLHIMTNSGNKVVWGAIADGHESVITIVLDMLGWALLAEKKDERNKLSGIVLIDELEQHLHPKWQRNIAKLLNEVFPNIQFIATTHSPICALGMANICAPDDTLDKIASLALLSQKGNQVEVYDNVSIPRGKRVDQILTSELFGLLTVRDDPSSKMLNKYAQFISEGETSKNNDELVHLSEFVSSEIGAPENELTSDLYKLFEQYRLRRIKSGMTEETLTELMESEILKTVQTFLKSKEE